MKRTFGPLTFAVMALASLALVATTALTATADEKIDLKKVKQEQGPQVQVVQNRAFSKEKRVKFSILTGAILTDPFINDYALGGKLAYHFNNFFSVQALGWKDLTKKSSSELAFRAQNGYGSNANYPKSLYALEGLWTPIYGKLNLLNESILYYDFHVGLGLGMRSTDSGSNMAYLINLGQDFFLSKHVTFEIDYRTLMFNQKIVEKINTATLGQDLGKEFEISHVFTLGFGFLF